MPLISVLSSLLLAASTPEGALAASQKALFDCTSLRTHYMVGLQFYSAELQKPNRLRLESVDRLIVADGSNITEYYKGDDTFDRKPETETALTSLLETPDTALIRGFFDASFASLLKVFSHPSRHESGGERYVEVSASAEGTAFTFFVDSSDSVTKMVRVVGGRGSKGEETLLTKDFHKNPPIDQSDFSFALPKGARNISDDASSTFARIQMPNLSQFSTFPELAHSSCCPVATADGLAWLSMNGFDRLSSGSTAQARAESIAHELVKYYKTDEEHGTTWDNMFPGLLKFLDDKGCPNSRLALYYSLPSSSWPVEVRGRSIPDIAAIQKASTHNSIVMLAIGKFNNPDVNGFCSRDNWHWVTVVGTDQAAGTVTFNDPYQKGSKPAAPLTIALKRLPSDSNWILGGGRGQFATADQPGAGIPILEKYPNLKPSQFAVIEGVLIIHVAK